MSPDRDDSLPARLDRALEELEATCAAKRPHPTRHDARAVLVPFGLLLMEGASLGLEDSAERVERATRTCSDRWRHAVTEEIQLACAEYVTSVDERYLPLPNYDFDYTSRARERLEARLLACDALGYPLPANTRSRIAEADRIYEPYLARREGSDDAPRS
jgi:hypothetical protein